MRQRHTRRTLGVVAVAAAAAIGLSGCVSFFVPEEPSKTSVPTDESVSPELKAFYKQVLQWENCGDGFQCATATAPLDWSDPGRESIKLALIRSVAKSSDRIGSLLVNPGGPGGSGYDFIHDSLHYAVSGNLIDRFDIVGFDPRGVGRSSAVSCYDDPTQMDHWLYDLPKNEFASDAWIAENKATSAEFGQACLDHTGDLLGFVDTNSAARDLDLLRAILGDKKLNYLGYSYGTLLGATYAELFPEKTGRLVLDGAIDPATSEFDVTATQAVGFESAMMAYLADCVTGSDCPFRGSPEQGMQTVNALLQSLQASPLRASDGRMLGASTMFTAIILPLYSQENWPYLNELFAQVMKGEADFAFQLADSYNGRNPDGTYRDNSTEAFTAINCLDYPIDSSVETLRAQAAELAKVAPVFGPLMSYGTSCDGWPFPAERDRQEIHASGSAPILVVGTTNDPATPYQWAVNLADQLDEGHLVTYQGEGHTAYNKSNACVNRAVDDFLINGTVPAADPMC